MTERRFDAAIADAAVARQKAEEIERMAREYLRTSRPPPPKEKP